ncbi:MAG: asparagine synthase (glutamine-hydrolyzing) [Candidatus Omnitrophota bacterium]
MCGLYTLYNFRGERVHEERIARALDLIAHRGDDRSGIYVDNHVGLGARRLSIIDIRHGQQPISNEDGTVVIVFNGEIFNYPELREKLVSKGHVFKTETDTEVILHLYEDKKEECVAELNGMFSFVIWDKRERRVFIARDRVGIKPLFYSTHNNTLRVGSEIKSFFSDKGFPKKLDMEALSDYFSFYYISSPKTIYAEIRRLKPGHCIIVENNKLEIRKYWDYKHDISGTVREDQVIESIKETLKKSVKRHLQSEVPLGIFLSGGLDSASILASISEYRDKIKAYTIGYDGYESYSEIEDAKKVADMCGAEHIIGILRPGQIPDMLRQCITYLDEPHGDWSQTAVYYASKLSRGDATVVLSGAGGDELFGGYPTLIAAYVAQLCRKVPRVVRDPVFYLLDKCLPVRYTRLSFDQQLRLFLKGYTLDPEQAHHRYKEIFTPSEKRSLLFKEEMKRKMNGRFDSFGVFDQYLKDYGDRELLNRLMYMDLKVFHPDCTLYPFDIITMANSQECRMPLLDLEMLELSRRIPPSLKVKNFTTKYVYRKAMRNILPHEMLRMRKKGFTIPADQWIREDALYKFTEEVIMDSKRRNAHLFDYGYIDGLLANHRRGKENNTRKITCLVSLFVWQEINNIHF